MPSLPCYHVEASNGLLYGVAALSKREAYELLQARLSGDNDGTARPVKASKVATWDAPYGTVLCYGWA